MHRLGHSHYSEGSVRHVGPHLRGHYAAELPDLQRHVCVHGGFSDLPGQVSDNEYARRFTKNRGVLLAARGFNDVKDLLPC